MSQPKIVWHGFGIDDDGRVHPEFEIRIVKTFDGRLVVETSGKDAMEAPCWKPLSLEQNWVLRAFVEALQDGTGDT